MKAGRNDPCPCGSGLKLKKCCLKEALPETTDLLWNQLNAIDRDFVDKLMKHAISTYGKVSMDEAWEEFWLSDPKEPISPNSPALQLFMPFFLYHWTPDIDSKVTPTAPRNTSIAQDYLEKRGGFLSPLEKRYLIQCLNTHFSFYEVLSVAPGQGLTVRDILLGAEVNISERSASKHLGIGDILFAKVTAIDHVATLAATSWFVIPPTHKIHIVMLRNLLKKNAEKSGEPLNSEFLTEFDIELRELFFDLHHATTAPPILTNTDGDPLVFHTITYTIDSAQLAWDQLKHLSVNVSEEQVLSTAEFDDRGGLKKVSFTWGKKGTQKKALGGTILAHIHVNDDMLTIEVNSVKRAKKMRKEIEKQLGEHASYVNTVTKTAQESLQEKPDLQTRDPSTIQTETEELMKNPEVRAQVELLAKKHWDNWYREPIPALGNLTPLQATKTEDGRELLESLLNDYERKSDPQQGPFRPDITAIRKKLGLKS